MRGPLIIKDWRSKFISAMPQSLAGYRIALHKDKGIVAYGKTLAEVVRQVEEQNIKDIVYDVIPFLPN